MHVQEEDKLPQGTKITVRYAASGRTIFTTVLQKLQSRDTYSIAVLLYILKSVLHNLPERCGSIMWRRDEGELNGQLILRRLTNEEKNCNRDNHKCIICMNPCEDVDELGKPRTTNCVRCEPCSLCSDCQVQIPIKDKGQTGQVMLCFECLTLQEKRALSERCRHRLFAVAFCSDSETEEE